MIHCITLFGPTFKYNCIQFTINSLRYFTSTPSTKRDTNRGQFCEHLLSRTISVRKNQVLSIPLYWKMSMVLVIRVLKFINCHACVIVDDVGYIQLYSRQNGKKGIPIAHRMWRVSKLQIHCILSDSDNKSLDNFQRRSGSTYHRTIMSLWINSSISFKCNGRLFLIGTVSRKQWNYF